MSATPFVAFCTDHCLNVKLKETRNLWFSTTITFKPFFNSKVTGFQFLPLGYSGFG
jgi:hypothetical protein